MTEIGGLTSADIARTLLRVEEHDRNLDPLPPILLRPQQVIEWHDAAVRGGETLQNIGTIEAQPVFIFILDSASSVTAANTKRLDGVGNTLDEIEYGGSIAAGDILEFDSEDKTVKENARQVTYTGAFPELVIGSNTIKFTVTGIVVFRNHNDEIP